MRSSAEFAYSPLKIFKNILKITLIFWHNSSLCLSPLAPRDIFGCCWVYSKHIQINKHSSKLQRFLCRLCQWLKKNILLSKNQSEAKLRHVFTIKMFWFVRFNEECHFSFDSRAKEIKRKHFRAEHTAYAFRSTRDICSIVSIGNSVRRTQIYEIFFRWLRENRDPKTQLPTKTLINVMLIKTFQMNHVFLLHSM